MTSGRLLDPDEARRRLESRLGPLHARLRLGIEREHEAQAFGQGLNFLHLENLPLMQAMIEIGLRVTGTYWRGRANAGKVQLRRNTCICQISNRLRWLHNPAPERPTCGHSGPAMQRVAELAPDLDYDLCVLTGDYRGRTYGDCEPCLKVIAHLREALRGDIYGVLGNHDSIAMVPDLEALGIRMLLNECVAIRSGSGFDRTAARPPPSGASSGTPSCRGRGCRAPAPRSRGAPADRGRSSARRGTPARDR